MDLLDVVGVVVMVAVIDMDITAVMTKVMGTIMKVMVEDMALETITATEVMVTTTMMIIMVEVVADMVMIVTVKARGVVLPVVGAVHPAEGVVVVAIREEVEIEEEEDQAHVVVPHPVVEEVALHLVVDPEAVVLPQLKGSMVQTRSRLLSSTLSLNAGLWVKTNQAAGEANQ